MELVRDVTGLSRRRRPLPEERRHLTGTAYDSPHDLSRHDDWWELAQPIRARNLRDHWRSMIVPSEIPLKQDSDRVYVTRGGKRVYVTTAREEAGRWVFDARIKSYEVLVLLCWSKDFKLYDYVVPQAAYVRPWTALKKRYGKESVRFFVSIMDGDVMLHLAPDELIDITSYRGEYKVMA